MSTVLLTVGYFDEGKIKQGRTITVMTLNKLEHNVKLDFFRESRNDDDD